MDYHKKVETCVSQISVISLEICKKVSQIKKIMIYVIVKRKYSEKTWYLLHFYVIPPKMSIFTKKYYKFPKYTFPCGWGDDDSGNCSEQENPGETRISG